MLRESLVDEIKELSDVSHKLLADTLAGAVDGQLQCWRGVEHGCSKHGDADCLSKPAKEIVND